MRETDQPVTQIALDVGFQSIGWFATAFKDVMGQTPTAYRDRHRGAPPPMIPGCFTLMWTRKSSFPDAGPGGGGGRAGAGENQNQPPPPA